MMASGAGRRSGHLNKPKRRGCPDQKECRRRSSCAPVRHAALAALLRVLACAGFLLVAGVVAAAPPARLTLWQGFKFSEVPMLRRNVDEFVAEYRQKTGREVVIEIGQVPFSDMVKRLKSAALARQMPDMVIIDANSMVQLAFGGVALPLDTLPNFPAASIDELRARYVPGAFDTNVITFKGERHLYGLPAQTTTLALFWNKGMFRAKAKELREAGLDPERAPRDWDEVVRYGKVLTEPSKNLYGFGMNNSFWFSMPFYNQYGVEIVRRNEAGLLEAAFRGPRAEAAVNRRVGLYREHGIEGGAWREGALDPDQGFLNQRYAMILVGPWQIENFRSSGLDFGVALVPRVPLAEAKALGLVPPDADENSTAAHALSASNIGGQNIMVSTSSKHPDIALEFALHFTSEKVQRAWAEELGQIPILLAAQQNLKLDKFPEVPVFIEQINLAKPLPALPYGAVLETEIVNPEMNLVLQGRQTAAQALERICAQMERRVLKPVNDAEMAARAEIRAKTQAGN
jgi:ABC-type glycerol-3-phosphate transport system substrate-binding protein